MRKHRNAYVRECVTHEFVVHHLLLFYSIFDYTSKNVCCLPFEDVKSLE